MVKYMLKFNWVVIVTTHLILKPKHLLQFLSNYLILSNILKHDVQASNESQL